MKYILKPTITLFITAVAVIALLSFVYNLTLEPIERQKRRTQEAVMRNVMPQAYEFREIQAEKTGSIVAVFEGHFHGDGANPGGLFGYIVVLSPKGYSGNIDLMVGISGDSITGMRVVRHNETPGLGALAVRPDFYRRFDGRPLIPLRVVRSSPGENEISAITSSTITTRAITNAVNEAIEGYLNAGIMESFGSSEGDGI
jgi:electron transport complex protein RnfG